MMQKNLVIRSKRLTQKKLRLGTILTFCSTSFLEKKLPVFIANFVLMEYGLGAIFGCPAHDQRDLDFALKYNLDVIQVVKNKSTEEDFSLKNEAMLESGTMINSDFLNGLDNETAKSKVLNRLEKKRYGKQKNQLQVT